MYSCPNCGSYVKYNIATQNMKCESCASEFDPYYFEKQSTQAQASEYFETTVYTCPQCGGELIGDVNETAVFCSFCGSSNILESRLTSGKRPAYVIPFSVTKEDCKKSYARFIRRAIFAPSDLKDPEGIDSFRGIYMPYWAYTMKQQGPVALHGIREHRKGDYIYTDHYETTGDLDASYEGFSMDASSAFDDRLSQAIAPYRYQERQEFSPAFLSGFYADAADVEQNVYQAEAIDFASDQSFQAIRKTPGVNPALIQAPKDLTAAMRTRVDHTDNCMFPVWFLSYRKGERVAYAAVNGQTGSIAADVPIDFRKFAIGSALLTVPLFLLLNMFLMVRPFTLDIITAVIGLVAAMACHGKRESLKDRDSAESLKGTFPPVYTWFLCLVATGLIWFWEPVSDIPYYLVALLSIGVMIANMLQTLRCHNLDTTRPLPQFNRKGGDDRA